MKNAPLELEGGTFSHLNWFSGCTFDKKRVPILIQSAIFVFFGTHSLLVF